MQFALSYTVKFVGTDWVDELREVGLRGGLQNYGYFEPLVSAQAKVITSSQPCSMYP